MYILFVRIDTFLKWLQDRWSLLLQSVLVGQVQKGYAALSLDQSSDYDTVKAAILRAYELVPEAYRQWFCQLRKTESQSHVDLAREQVCIFDRSCGSQEVKDLKDFDTRISLAFQELPSRKGCYLRL